VLSQINDIEASFVCINCPKVQIEKLSFLPCLVYTYISATEVKKTFGVSNSCLKNWHKLGKISARQAPGGKRYYLKEELESLFSISRHEEKSRTGIIYCRVSSKKQVDSGDFQRQAFKVNFMKLRQGRIKKFRVKFRSKKDPSQSILIPKASFSKRYPGVFYEKSTGRQPIKSNVPIPRPEDIGSDCRLQYLRTDKWFLIVPMAVKEKENKIRQVGEEKFIALDAGVRTFMTGYAPTDEGQGYAFEFGKGDTGRLIRLAKASNELQAKIASAGKKRKRKKRRLRQAMLRNNERIRHTRAELHWKVASFMCQNFTSILLPVFETQNMAKRAKREIRSKTARRGHTTSSNRG
jgi:transposase